MLIIKHFFIELFWGMIRYPIWWYSKGLVQRVKSSFDGIEYYARSLAISVWVKNIFVPMFGQRDWQSRIISFFIRIANIIIRSLLLILWMVIMIALILVYILIPPTLIILFLFSLSG